MRKGNLCNAKIGKKIKESRMNKGFDIIEFSRELSVSRSSVNNWEKGVFLPTLENVVKICNLLGISIDELIIFED